MIRIDVVPLPKNLQSRDIQDRAVAIFDVLRATTTMATALAAGAREIHAFDSLQAAQEAAAKFSGEKLLCGERRALRPPGFDLGNSPAEFTADRVAGKTLFMATTNGTRAIVAVQQAKKLFAAALVNAAATANALIATGLDVVLLCAGTDGEIATEDLIGAGAVIDSIKNDIKLNSEAQESVKLFQDSRNNLAIALRASRGGRNCIAAGLESDIDLAAIPDALNVVVEIRGHPPIARKSK
jgi:2-phosphosulfolactate phosphatase